MKERKKLTIYDIAKLSGFSPKTVSRVVNGGDSVKKSTYDSIKKIIDEYNYIPNTYARSLISKTNKNILISVQKREAYPLKWFSILLEKITVECRRYDMNVIVEYVNRKDDMKNSILHSSSSFIGVAVLFYECDNDKRVSHLKKLGIPFIIFGKSDTNNVKYVSNNDYQSLYTLIEYLLERGLQRTLLLIGNKSLVNMDRVRGAQDSIVKNGLNRNLIEVVDKMESIDDVYRFSMDYFSKEKLPDAIFVSGDEKVIGLFRALNKLGIKVPDEVSVIGFDNIPEAEYYSPALTTFAQDYQTLAKEIVKRLRDLLNGNDQFSSIEIPTKLIIRESVR